MERIRCHDREGTLSDIVPVISDEVAPGCQATGHLDTPLVGLILMWFGNFICSIYAYINSCHIAARGRVIYSK